MRARFILIYSLVAAVGIYLHLHSDIDVPLNRPLAQMPAVVGPWRMAGQFQFSEEILKLLAPSDYLIRSYRDDSGDLVDMYIGYHSGGPGIGGIHSPRHCLPGSGWYNESTEEHSMTVGAGTLSYVLAVYVKGEQRTMFAYWFQMQDRTLTDEYELKLAEILSSLTDRRRDKSFIRLSTNVPGDVYGAGERGREVLEAFMRDFYPYILEYLPQ